MSGGGDLGALEERLGHAFAEKSLLVAALTHASARARRRGETYERLEFLGDRVLGLVVADMLVERFGDASEGDLARRLARLVSGEACAEAGRAMGLDQHIRAAGGTLKSGERAAAGILADACEAVIGAIYRDGGLEPARRLIERYWRPELESMQGPLRDAKTELQEWAHRRNLETPRYQEVGRSGPDHAPEFIVEAVIGGAEGATAKGPSKREAEQEAAKIVLQREGVWKP